MEPLLVVGGGVDEDRAVGIKGLCIWKRRDFTYNKAFAIGMDNGDGKDRWNDF